MFNKFNHGINIMLHDKKAKDFVKIDDELYQIKDIKSYLNGNRVVLSLVRCIDIMSGEYTGNWFDEFEEVGECQRHSSFGCVSASVDDDD